MTKKTGSKPRKQRQRPPLALKVACPSCGALPSDPCILLTAPGLKIPKKKDRFAENASLSMPSPAPHASRVTAYEASVAKPKRQPR
jgi:hypothetical protein